MSSPVPASHDPVSAPTSRQARWVEMLLWVFLLSFAFDYRADVDRESTGGAGLDQMLFLASCVGSSFGIFVLGWRHLSVRPGAWLIGFWTLFLSYMMANSILQGVIPSRSVRVFLPLAFSLFAMVNAHIAACMGIRASKIVTPVLVAACVNVLWRIIHGFVFKHVSIETVRLEVQSPATNWIAAWIACAVLLRGRIAWSLPIACSILFTGVVITITRSLIFPVVAGGIAGAGCFLLGIKWGIFTWPALGKRVLILGGAVALVIVGLAIAAVAEPILIERWNERMFHNTSERNLSADISYLTRKAEADAIWEILSRDPVHFINGRGVGSSYYWHPAYREEIYSVIPKEVSDLDDIWFAGHSVWTYGLLSGGAIALCCYVALFVSTIAFSLTAARANASDPGPDTWLAFLPAIATCCLLSESLTANPFQERLTGILFGIMAGLPQAFMVRASWIHACERPPALCPA